MIYPVAERYREQFRKKYDMLIDQGIWVPMAAPNASPAIVIGKKDKSEIRAVVDLRERNKIPLRKYRPCPESIK